MITSIIIDDEQHCVETLMHDIKHYDIDLTIIATTNSAIEAIEIINTRKPELVFLDIEMPFMNGFEMLKNCTYKEFDVIFTTAYNEHAVKAFKYSAIDYLMKPIRPEELVSAVERYKKKNSKTLKRDHLNLLLEHLTNQSEKQLKIAFSTSDGIEFINPKDIIRCEASGNYCTIYKNDSEKILLSKPLKEVQGILPESSFLRVHQSHLINTSYVKKFIKTDGGHLVMNDGSKINVARSKRDLLINSLQ